MISFVLHRIDLNFSGNPTSSLEAEKMLINNERWKLTWLIAYIFNCRTKLRIVWVRDPNDKVDKGATQHDEIIRVRVDASPSQVRGHGA